MLLISMSIWVLYKSECDSMLLLPRFFYNDDIFFFLFFATHFFLSFIKWHYYASLSQIEKRTSQTKLIHIFYTRKRTTYELCVFLLISIQFRVKFVYCDPPKIFKISFPFHSTFIIVIFPFFSPSFFFFHLFVTYQTKC